jgi:molybdenum cofactor cytidylyltransferase
MSVAAVVLAAGTSRRLGRPKQNVILAGETLLERTVRVSREAGLSPIIVVARQGAKYPKIKASHNAIIVINREADEGIASSIRCGVSEAARHTVAGAVILTCDQPALQPGHLSNLIEDQHRVTASTYDGSLGVPSYFPAAIFPSLLQLRGDTGARGLLKTAYAIRADELKLDIDTEHDLDIARDLFESRQSHD